MNSIKTFLITTILAVIVLAVFISSIQGYNKSRASAEKLFDAQLADISLIIAQTDQDKASLPQIYQPLKTNIVYRVWNEKQQLIVQSHQLAQDFHSQLNFTNSLGYENFNSTRWRTMLQFYPEHKKWIWVAENNDIRFKLADGILLESIIPSLLVIPVIGLLILLIVHKGLKPVNNLASEIANKKANDLTLIEMTELPTELLNLTDSVNQLFVRLENSFIREKQLASDAAHELRTPIAVLILQIENLIAEQPDNPDINSLKATAKRLSRLVEQILTLNKTTPELFAQKMQTIDLAPILRQVTASHFDLVESKGQSVDMDVASCFIESDYFAIETLFSNLLLNAIKYTQEEGKIKVRLYQTDKQVILEVHDNGPGIPVEYRERVLKRFYRLDNDRSQSQVVGCGLGFSIIEHIVELHQAALLLLDSEFEKGLAVRVTFSKKDSEIKV